MKYVKSLPHGVFVIKADGSASFLFLGNERALLIDTGTGAADCREIAAALTSLPLDVAVTHHHFDHIGGIGQFDSVYAFDQSLICRSGKPVHPLRDGDRLSLGGRELEVLHLPGHSFDSVMFLDRAHRLLVAGDSVSGRPIYMGAPTADLRTYLASMDRVLSLEGTVDLILCAHGRSAAGMDLAHDCRELAAACLSGTVEGEPSCPLHDPQKPAMLYRLKNASFLI